MGFFNIAFFQCLYQPFTRVLHTPTQQTQLTLDKISFIELMKANTLLYRRHGQEKTFEHCLWCCIPPQHQLQNRQSPSWPYRIDYFCIGVHGSHKPIPDATARLELYALSWFSAGIVKVQRQKSKVFFLKCYTFTALFSVGHSDNHTRRLGRNFIEVY